MRRKKILEVKVPDEKILLNLILRLLRVLHSHVVLLSSCRYSIELPQGLTKSNLVPKIVVKRVLSFGSKR